MFHVGQTIEGVNRSVLRGGEDWGEYVTVRVREYFGRDHHGIAHFSVVDLDYGQEYDTTDAELERAVAA